MVELAAPRVDDGSVVRHAGDNLICGGFDNITLISGLIRGIGDDIPLIHALGVSDLLGKSPLLGESLGKLVVEGSSQETTTNVENLSIRRTAGHFSIVVEVLSGPSEVRASVGSQSDYGGQERRVRCTTSGVVVKCAGEEEERNWIFICSL